MVPIMVELLISLSSGISRHKEKRAPKLRQDATWTRLKGDNLNLNIRHGLFGKCDKHGFFFLDIEWFSGSKNTWNGLIVYIVDLRVKILSQTDGRWVKYSKWANDGWWAKDGSVLVLWTTSLYRTNYYIWWTDLLLWSIYDGTRLEEI